MDEKPADLIREYCLSLVKHARSQGQPGLVILAGNVHNELKFSNRMPAVCSVLGSDTFEREARVKRIAVDGPINGASALFAYRIR